MESSPWWSPAESWAQRDAGKWSVIAWTMDGHHAGTAVVTVTTDAAGRILDVIACRFGSKRRRWAKLVEQSLTQLARRHGCRALRARSPRPVHRLISGVERRGPTTYTKAIDHASS